MVFVLWLLVELVMEVLAAIFLEVLLALVHAFDEDEGARIPAAVFLMMLGAILGTLSVVAAPIRLLPPRPFPGVSFVIAPVVTGLVMETWGRDKARRQRSTSHLATWYGGGRSGSVSPPAGWLLSRSLQESPRSEALPGWVRRSTSAQVESACARRESNNP